MALHAAENGNWKHLFFITLIFAYLLIYFSSHNDVLLHWLSCPRLHTLSSVTLTLRKQEGSFHFTNKEAGACWNYASSLSGRAVIQARMSDYKAHEDEEKKKSKKKQAHEYSLWRLPATDALVSAHLSVTRRRHSQQTPISAFKTAEENCSWQL